MNTYLLGLAGKWITILLVSAASIFNSNDLNSETNYEVSNLNQLKNGSVSVVVLDYKTKKEYNSNLPEGTVKTKQEGKKGLAYVDEHNNKTQVVEDAQDEIIEVGTAPKSVYVGKLTGYGADCVGCSGSVACPTKKGKWNLNNNGLIYNDDEYGSVRILAAALDKFPCGTIIEVVSPSLGTFNAIVLDTGGSMRSAWRNGNVHMDLAFSSENSSAIYSATGNNITFNIKRWGW